MDGIIRQIGDIQADVTVEETHRDEIMITNHPVERGAPITDHAYRQPRTLAVKIGFTNSTLSEYDPSYLRDIYTQLRGMQLTPLTVVTGKAIYNNMLIQSIEITTDEETEYSLFIAMELREVILTQTSTITFADPSTQATPQVTTPVKQEGTKQLKPSTKTVPSAYKDLHDDYARGVG